MITDENKQLLLQQYYDRGVLKKEIRSYEVSLWTLQDEFITVLKWSDVEQKGRIEKPIMTLNIDGTQNFNFSIPMYIWYEVEDANGSYLKKKENPIWYNTQNDNMIVNLRKVKVIFNKEQFDPLVIKNWDIIFKQAYLPINYFGNVDLYNRPIVPASAFTSAGYTFNGTYGTIFSSSKTFSLNNVDYDIIYTQMRGEGKLL